MAKKKQEQVKEQEGYRFQVKEGDVTVSYKFNVDSFKFDKLNQYNVSDLFDEKGAPTKESAAVLQKLVKIKSGILTKEE